MATFQYVKQTGGLGTIDAPDSSTALRMLPADADPKSGVMEGGGLSGTSNPSPSDRGSGVYELPRDGKKGGVGGVLSFADALDEAVNLARKKRNESSLGMMDKFSGTLAASDFNQILGNLNKASDDRTQKLIERETGTGDRNIITATADDGTVTGIDKNTGEIVWQAPGVGNKQGGSGGASDVLLRSGALTYTKSDYSDDASQLETSRGDDGWVDPSIYKRLYDTWVANGGKIADFVKTYPPAQYVNPANDWLPPYLRPKATGGTEIPSFLQ